MSERGKWDGVRAIAGFNWPYYLVAILVLVIGILAIGWFPVAGALVVSGCSYFLIGSLGVSHWIYDRSDLYQWLWLKRALNPVEGGKWLLCHSGFDEVSGMLIQKFPGAELRILDHYEPTTMTEASIQRARKLFPPTAGTLAARFDQWPVEDASLNVVFGILAIHELRNEGERAAWFSEARRCLAEEGKVILVEHLRDLANFAAFGPGFLHFHSVAGWQRSWENGGLQLKDHFRITPFVKVFVLKKL